jgi:TRAP-type C4-dicarboxylate transport system permease small subunit
MKHISKISQLSRLALRMDPFIAAYLRITKFCVITICIGMFAIMFVSNSYNIFARWLFDTSITWHQEVSLISAMWIYFMAYSLISKDNAYIRISFLVDKLSLPIRNIVFYTSWFAVICFHSILLKLIIDEIAFVSDQKSYLLEWPVYLLIIPLGVGTTDIIITEILLFIRHNK